MIGPKEKKMPQTNTKPEISNDSLLNLRALPKYICYKAALIREKLLLKQILGATIIVFAAHVLITRWELIELQKKLREKEYILAPGVTAFTPASALTVTDSYVSEAVDSFLNTLGNVNPHNIDDQIRALSNHMDPRLKVKFQAEVVDWIKEVKSDDISQILSIVQKEVKSNDSGYYEVSAVGKAEYYSNHSYIGGDEQNISMRLKLVPPSTDKRWFLQIVDLSWQKQKN